MIGFAILLEEVMTFNLSDNFWYFINSVSSPFTIFFGAETDLGMLVLGIKRKYF